MLNNKLRSLIFSCNISVYICTKLYVVLSNASENKMKAINFVLSILRLRINLPYYRSFVIPMKWTFKDKPRLYRTSYISKYLLRSLGLRYIRVLLYLNITLYFSILCFTHKPVVSIYLDLWICVKQLSRGNILYIICHIHNATSIYWYCFSYRIHQLERLYTRCLQQILI